MVTSALLPPHTTKCPTCSQGHQIDRGMKHLDDLTPPRALPPLSLPLPAPRKRTGSDHTDPESIILTPTDDDPLHSDPKGFAGGPSGSNEVCRAGTPYPFRPICHADPHDLPSITSFRLASKFPQPDLPPPHQKAKILTTADQHQPPGPSGPIIVQRILELTSTIDQVYTAYTRLDRRVQSPILLLSLRQFRDRSKALRNAGRAMGRNLAQYTLEEQLQGDEYYVVEELESLEAEWWSSEVVANWFGPLPRQTQYRGRASRQGANRTRVGNRHTHDRPEGRLVIVSEDGLGLTGHSHCPDQRESQGLGEGIMSERAVDLRRLSSFVGLWDE